MRKLRGKPFSRAELGLHPAAVVPIRQAGGCVLTEAVSSLDAHTALPYHDNVKSTLIFEWNEAKADENYRKHRVTFQLAARAFEDVHGLDLVDDRMDYGEER